MRNARINYLAVGTFVLAMIVAGVVLVARIAGNVGATDRYSTTFDSVLGIVPGTQVLYEGYPIGQVSSMRPAEAGSARRFRVELALRQGWPIPEDSTAFIISPSLLAPMTIDIHAGTSKDMLPVGGEIAGREATNLLGAVSSITGDVDLILRDTVRPLLQTFLGSSPAILENIQGFTASLDSAGKDLRGVISNENKERLSRILSNVEKASVDLAALSSELGKTRAEFDRALASVNGVLAGRDTDADRVAADLRHTLGSIASHIDALNENLEGASQNLYEFSREVRANPGSLLSGKPPRDDAPAVGAGAAR